METADLFDNRNQRPNRLDTLIHRFEIIADALIKRVEQTPETEQGDLTSLLTGLKSLLLGLRDLELARNKEVVKGADLESRFLAFCHDGELQRYALDAVIGGRGWNPCQPCWSDRKLAAEEAARIQKAFERRVGDEHGKSCQARAEVFG